MEGFITKSVDFDIELDGYVVNISGGVLIYEWYDPGVWTYPNGDPGYPPDGGWEIRENNCTATFYNADGVVAKVESAEGFEDAIENELDRVFSYGE